MRVSDFLTIRDFTSQELLHLLDLARDIKATPAQYQDALKGKTLALIFEKPSLRTRVSFDVGIQQLGGFSVYLSPAEINLGKRESVFDVAKNLERMVQGIMIRTFGHDIVEKMAEYASVPVINGLTDFSHPCQAMADFLTIREHKGTLEGLKLAYVGDSNNVSNSLMFAAARFGVHVAIGSPAGYQPTADVTAWTRDEGRKTGSTLLITTDPAEAVEDADVVYTDTWASMGQEAEAYARKAVFRPYQVNAHLFRKAKKDALFMHCLPAHRGDEVTDDVIDSPHSVVFDEAENRLHAQKAIMLEMMK
ncbi:MAG: ornithine carbamoyltransferase [Acidobacteria bacterium]|nr:ornithine carbamoyltransferase [Acidobacteriota bacterium]